MRIFSRGLAILLMISVCPMGCSKPESRPEEAAQPAIEDDYLRLLSDLTQIMDADYADPAQNLEALRKYIETSRPAAAGTLNALNRDVLTLKPEARETWRRAAKPRLEEHLERFARAQLQLRKRLNDAQNWELNEILGLLHS